MMNPPAEEESEFAQTGDNVDGKGGWWLAPIVWGPKWLIICFLMVTVFNHKWADIKYYQFDSRDHFGFGTWSTCNKLSAASCPAIFLYSVGANYGKLSEKDRQQESGQQA